jgi:hypothetical protein
MSLSVFVLYAECGAEDLTACSRRNYNIAVSLAGHANSQFLHFSYFMFLH